MMLCACAESYLGRSVSEAVITVPGKTNPLAHLACLAACLHWALACRMRDLTVTLLMMWQTRPIYPCEKSSSWESSNYL